MVVFLINRAWSEEYILKAKTPSVSRSRRVNLLLFPPIYYAHLSRCNFSFRFRLQYKWVRFHTLALLWKFWEVYSVYGKKRQSFLTTVEKFYANYQNIYTDKDIFIRELVSMKCDTVTKYGLSMMGGYSWGSIQDSCCSGSGQENMITVSA